MLIPPKRSPVLRADLALRAGSFGKNRNCFTCACRFVGHAIERHGRRRWFSRRLFIPASVDFLQNKNSKSQCTQVYDMSVMVLSGKGAGDVRPVVGMNCKFKWCAV